MAFLPTSLAPAWASVACSSIPSAQFPGIVPQYHDAKPVLGIVVMKNFLSWNEKLGFWAWQPLERRKQRSPTQSWCRS